MTRCYTCIAFNIILLFIRIARCDSWFVTDCHVYIYVILLYYVCIPTSYIILNADIASLSLIPLWIEEMINCMKRVTTFNTVAQHNGKRLEISSVRRFYSTVVVVAIVSFHGQFGRRAVHQSDRALLYHSVYVQKIIKIYIKLYRLIVVCAYNTTYNIIYTNLILFI